MEPGDARPDELDTEPLPPSIEEALLRAAADLPGVVVRGDGARREFRVGSVVVARLAGPVAEYRLDPAVIKAALRTPDTKPVEGASEWVAFEPARMDRYATDRAVAWLQSAVRRAG
jgi:hypothetical protein